MGQGLSMARNVEAITFMARRVEMYRPLYRKKYREVSVIHCHKELSKFLYIKSSLYFLPHYIPVEAGNVEAITLYGKACRNVRELFMARNIERSLQYIAIESSLHFLRALYIRISAFL